MKVLYTLLLCCTVSTGLFAQIECYESRLKRGNEAFNTTDYDKAIARWQAAIDNCDLSTAQSSALKQRIQDAENAKNKPIITTTPVVTEPTQLSFEPDMVRVEGGTFSMGSTDSEAYSDEKPVHSVTLSSFYIGKFEVTQRQWREVMGSDPPELAFKGCDNCPVEHVSWEDIQTFLQKINAKTGKKYRLPTEAEWEYAARGGQNSKNYKYSGSNNVADVAWYGSNSDSKTHPVGTKSANELGIFDMTGNVWEWCSDWKVDYSSSAVTNPTGAATGSGRVLRGGSWYDYPLHCRVAIRSDRTPAFRNLNFGFRVAYSFQ